MAAVTTIVAAAAVGVAAVGTVASISQQRKASQAQSQAAAEQRKAAETQANRDAYVARQERLQQLRAQQQERAQIIASGAGAGTLQSSGVQGMVSGEGTTASSNQSFVNQVNAYNQNISSTLQKAADFRGVAQQASVKGNIYSGIAGIGTQVFSMSGASFGGGQAAGTTG